MKQQASYFILASLFVLFSAFAVSAQEQEEHQATDAAEQEKELQVVLMKGENGTIISSGTGLKLSPDEAAELSGVYIQQDEYEIVQYRFMHEPIGHQPFNTSALTKNNMFSEDITDRLGMAEPGDIYILTEITAEDPEGNALTAKGIIFTIE